MCFAAEQTLSDGCDTASRALQLIDQGNDSMSVNSDVDSDGEMKQDTANTTSITAPVGSMKVKTSLSARFAKGFTKAVDDDEPKSKSARVVPIVDNEHDGAKSESSSVGTGSTIGLFHRAIERGIGGEEPSLVILRWLMLVVILFVIILSVTTLSISSSVVASKVTSATLLSLGGDRSIGQLVSAIRKSCHHFPDICVGILKALQLNTVQTKIPTMLLVF